MEIPNSFGAISTIATISKQAGTKHIKMAGRPTFSKSFISKARPARVKIIIKATCLRYGDMDNIEPSSQLRA